MFVPNKKHQERSLFDTVNQLSPMMRKRLDNSWAAVFYKEIFCHIDESIFSVLYSDVASRPNSAINVLVGAELLKSHFRWSDEQLFNECAFNLQVRYALGSCDFDNELFSERTLYHFRQRLNAHYQKTGTDLIEQVFKAFTEAQLKRFEIKSGTQRMDSTQVSSNIRRYSRIGLLVEVIIRFHRQLSPEDQKRYESEFAPYVSSRQTSFCYRLSSDDLDETLEEIGRFMAFVLKEFESGYSATPAYRQLLRVFGEHFDSDDETPQSPTAKSPDQIPAHSLRSPDDEDATVTRKGNEDFTGYAINASETCETDNPFQLITETSVANNRTSDSQFFSECMAELVEKTGLHTMLTDATYSDTQTDKLCEKLGVTHLQSAIRGREHQAEKLYLSDFQFENEGDLQFVTCPSGHRSQVVAGKGKDRFIAYFPHEICQSCPFAANCKTTHRRKARALYFDSIDQRRALRWQRHLAFRAEGGNPRAGVERIMGLFKYRLPNGQLPIRGLARVSQYVFATAIMINFSRIFRHLEQLGLDIFILPLISAIKRCYGHLKTATVRLKFILNFILGAVAPAGAARPKLV